MAAGGARREALTFGWGHQEVDGLGGQTGPHAVDLSLQVGVAQPLCQDPCGRPWKGQEMLALKGFRPEIT